MDSMIHVGNSDKHDSAENSAKAIVTIFEGARKHTMDQHTVEKALEALMRISEVKNVTITNSTFTNKPANKQEKEEIDSEEE